MNAVTRLVRIGSSKLMTVWENTWPQKVTIALNNLHCTYHAYSSPHVQLYTFKNISQIRKRALFYCLLSFQLSRLIKRLKNQSDLFIFRMFLKFKMVVFSLVRRSFYWTIYQQQEVKLFGYLFITINLFYNQLKLSLPSITKLFVEVLCVAYIIF